MDKLILKSGREKSLLRRHPWIFSGALKQVTGNPAPGETLEVVDSHGKFIAYASWSPKSRICARVWSFEQKEVIDRQFFARKIAQALQIRRSLNLTGDNQAYRLIAAEGDYLPGFTVDVYCGYPVIQITSAGAEFNREIFFEALLEELGCEGAYERSDLDVRKLEGLDKRSGVYGKAPNNKLIEFEENSLRFKVDYSQGHKTGFYLDQRENRQIAMSLAAGRRVLNTFSYTGAFGVAVLRGNAKSVVNVDSSMDSLELGEENFRLNGFDPDGSQVTSVRADVFEYLRKLRDDREKFDLIILDPPKLIEGMATLQRGARAYKDLALSAFKLLNPGGILLNFSCSGLMDAALFGKITADAALDAGVNGRIIGQMRQAADHPVALSTPEGSYLKGLITIVN